jgi:hypothetical protein
VQPPTAFVEKAETLTGCDASVCIDAVKCFAWLLLAFLFATVNSCTTLVNRRDLYSPEPGPDSLEAAASGTVPQQHTQRRRQLEAKKSFPQRTYADIRLVDSSNQPDDS